MDCPKCSIATKQTGQRKLSTGQRIERQCEMCDSRFITYADDRRELFVRWVDDNARINPQQQRAFNLLCLGLSRARLSRRQKRQAIRALKLTKIAVGANGKSPTVYFTGDPNQ